VGRNPAFASLLLPLLIAASPPDRNWEYCRGNDPEKAISACTALIRAGGALQEAAHYDRANAWRHMNQRQKALAGTAPARHGDPLLNAIVDYDTALNLRPDFAEAYVNRGIVRFERGDYHRAIADATSAIVLRPDLAEAWNNRSLAQFRAGNYAAAKADFDQTIRLNKNYGNALINRELGPL
jgi:tetratricopeptide (TPR) repeat protein